jgi:phosphate transport system substrate-binding protein
MRWAVALTLLASTADATLQLDGAGATFPAPLYARWFFAYSREHPEVRFNYQAIGSGAGVKQIASHAVDFGASDAPLSDEQMRQFPGLVMVPAVLGAVAIVYNLPGVQGLKLSPEALAAVFLGTITRWDDPLIARDNPDALLPARPIAVAHRDDASGTTFVFTEYLSKVSPEWRAQVGNGTTVRWPIGIGGRGSNAIASLVGQAQDSIGYVELAHARQARLQVAALRNPSGNWVLPGLHSIEAAAEGVEPAADLRASLTASSSPKAWPLSSFTYLLVYRDHPDARKGEALLRFLWWALNQGQTMAAAMDYVPLPERVAVRVRTLLRTLSAGGRQVLGAATQ